MSQPDSHHNLPRCGTPTYVSCTPGQSAVGSRREPCGGWFLTLPLMSRVEAEHGRQVREAGSYCRHRSIPVVLLVELVGADGGFELVEAGGDVLVPAGVGPGAQQARERGRELSGKSDGESVHARKLR